LITTLSRWKPGVSAAYVGSPTAIIAPVPEYRNTVPPWLPLAVLAPRKAHPRSATFLVPAVTINWLAVEMVAQGSSTVAFAVDIVRFDPIDRLPVKFRASHVPP
jgi:hypothetical protein